MNSPAPIRQNVQVAQEFVLTAAKILSRDLSPEQVFSEMLQAMCEQLGWLTGSFFKLDESGEELSCQLNHCCQPLPYFHSATEQLVLKRGEGLPGRVWASGTPVWVPDVGADDNFPRREAARREGIHAGFAFPVTAGGKFIGVFEFFAQTVRQQDNELLNAFAVVGTALGQFLERRRVELALAELATLNLYAADIGTTLNSVEPLGQILATCADLTLRHLDLVTCRIWLTSDQGGFNLISQSGERSLPAEKKVVHEIDEVQAHALADGAGNLSYYCAFPLRSEAVLIGAMSVMSKCCPNGLTIDFLTHMADNIALCVARKQSEEKLHASEARFRAFAQVVDECFFISAPRLTEHYYVSPGFEKIWGIPTDQVLADAGAWQQAIIPEHRQRVADYVNQLTGETMPETPEIDYAIARADGSIGWLSARCFRIDQGNGNWHICGTVRDITERKRAEERISDFYSTVSHELRTPLTSIKGSLLLLVRGKGGPLPVRANQLILIASKECDRLIRLINDMLDMKTIEVGKLQLYRENLVPGELVAQTVELMQNIALDAQVELKTEINTNSKIYADKDRLIQVLTNLLSNAIKFSPANVQVTVKVEDREGCVRFSVADCGHGIPKELQGNLFNLFPKLEPDGATGKQGTGLGLAISKGIVEEHGGAIGVVSDRGAGAVFWFDVPVAS